MYKETFTTEHIFSYTDIHIYKYDFIAISANTLQNVYHTAEPKPYI